MTIEEAEDMIIDAYENYSHPDGHMLIEAVRFLAEETRDPMHITHLGALYRETGRSDLALKCFEEAATRGYADAYACLGQMWSSGEAGAEDQAKALEYYTKAAAGGDTGAECRLADMYRYGWHAEKDHDRYCKMIEAVYERVKDSSWMDEPLTDVLSRMAEIRRDQGRTGEAIGLLHEARLIQSAILKYAPVAEELQTMEKLTESLYEMTGCDLNDLGLFDVFHLFRKPCRVRFEYEGRSFEAEAVPEGGAITVIFDGRCYRSAGEFLEKAHIGGDRLAAIANDIYGMEVIR